MTVLMGLWLPLSQSYGATFYFDTSSVNYDQTWNTTTVEWRTAPNGGGSATTWVNGSTSAAVFETATGLLSLGTNITATVNDAAGKVAVAP